MNRGINDLRDKEAKTIVVFGDSHAAGTSASASEMTWPEILKDLIDVFQDNPVDLINNSLSADVLSKSSPMYEDYEGKRPIGIERYEKHIIDPDPDIVILSYGYNDLRSGTPIDDFRKDFETVLKSIKSSTEALIIVLNIAAIPSEGYENTTGGTDTGKSWDHGTRETHTLYNLMLNDVAEDQKVVFVDVHSAQVRAPWTFCSTDGKGDNHANDLGHRLIAHRVFETLATRCSFMSVKPQKTMKKATSKTWRYNKESREAEQIADFYPDSPEVARHKKKPTKKAKK